MKLLGNSYGKARVRVMKVTRHGKRHSVKELDVSVMLQGKFAESYTHDDNRLLVATDTMKNTVNILAQQFLGAETEEFGIALSEHFLKTYRHIEQAAVRLQERAWERIAPRGRPHPHSFFERSAAHPFAEVTTTRKGTLVQSGIEDLLVLKTTGSGFEDYLKDKYTTLRETQDRLLCTIVNAVWTYSSKPKSYSKINKLVIDAMLGEFATRYSPSVQATIYEMGKAALAAAPAISKITLALPNKHCLPIDLSAFGLANRRELFLPTDEPHGQIEGTIAR